MLEVVPEPDTCTMVVSQQPEGKHVVLTRNGEVFSHTVGGELPLGTFNITCPD